MRSGLQLIYIWTGGLMILLVMGGAAAFTFTDFMDDRLYGTKRTLFILMLVAYGIYRGFRLRSALSQRNENN